MTAYYFLIDSPYRATHARIEHDHESQKTLQGLMDAENELKRCLEPVERIKTHLPRKPRGIDFEVDRFTYYFARGFKTEQERTR